MKVNTFNFPCDRGTTLEAVSAKAVVAENVRELQRGLYRAAKRSGQRKFHALYDRVCQESVLKEAWSRVRAKRGAAGVDEETLGAIERYGVERMVQELQEGLREGTYHPQPVRRVYIPKPDGRQRPLGIPTVSANCTGAQIAFRMGGDPPSVPSASRPALPGFERAPVGRY